MLVVAVVATSDKTSAARVEYGSFAATVAILTNIAPAVSTSDLVITFANIMAPSSLLAALNTAVSIILSN